MVDKLIVPLTFAGSDIDRNEAAGEQIVAVSIAAVVVTCRVFYG